MMTTSSSAPKVLVCDAQAVWLRAIERIATDAGMAPTTTSSPAEALNLLVHGGFDIVMFGAEAGPGNLNWRQLLTRSKKLAPKARFILVGEEQSREAVRQALELGADAYVTRIVEPEDLVFAIRQVLSPELYLIWPFVGSRSWVENGAAQPFGLTRRETEALELIARGRSNAEIAQELGITEQTVKGHLWRLYRKLGVTNRTAAARWMETAGGSGEGSATVEGA
jgi:DNA-binding NarL/FixJ family response regulator